QAQAEHGRAADAKQLASRYAVARVLADLAGDDEHDDFLANAGLLRGGGATRRAGGGGDIIGGGRVLGNWKGRDKNTRRGGGRGVMKGSKQKEQRNLLFLLFAPAQTKLLLGRSRVWRAPPRSLLRSGGESFVRAGEDGYNLRFRSVLPQQIAIRFEAVGVGGP